MVKSVLQGAEKIQGAEEGSLPEFQGQAPNQEKGTCLNGAIRGQVPKQGDTCLYGAIPRTGPRR